MFDPSSKYLRPVHQAPSVEQMRVSADILRNDAGVTEYDDLAEAWRLVASWIDRNADQLERRAKHRTGGKS